MVVIVGGFNKVLVGTFFGHCETSQRFVVGCIGTGAIKTSEIRSLPPACADLATGPLGQPRLRQLTFSFGPSPGGQQPAASNQCLTPVNCSYIYIYIYIYIPAPAIINPSVHTADIAMSAWWPVPAASSTAHHILI